MKEFSIILNFTAVLRQEGDMWKLFQRRQTDKQTEKKSFSLEYYRKEETISLFCLIWNLDTHSDLID